MANHPRRNWRKRWTVDPVARTVTHDSGVSLSFPNGDNVIPAEQIAAALARLKDQHGTAAAIQMLERMVREAREVYERSKQS